MPGGRPHVKRDHTYDPRTDSPDYVSVADPVAVPTLHSVADPIRNGDWTTWQARRPRFLGYGLGAEEPHIYGNRISYAYWQRPRVIRFDPGLAEARPRKVLPPAPMSYAEQVPTWDQYRGGLRSGTPRRADS
jgi:hypothetical protein